MDYFRVGVIKSTHGLKGEVRVKVITDFDRFYKGSRLFIYNNKDYIEVIVKDAKDYKDDDILVTFKGLEDINLIEKYKGMELYISEEDQGELDEGYYYDELIGKDVVNQDGVLRGKVVDIEEVPQGYILVVDVNSERKKIPFVQDVFIKDVNDNQIIINEIEGLLWK